MTNEVSIIRVSGWLERQSSWSVTHLPTRVVLTFVILKPETGVPIP